MKHLKADIEKALADKHIVRQWHSNGEFQILNYSPVCQYDKIWTEVTMQCRGLILDKDFNVIARPFRKFKNYEEHKQEEIPSESFEVFQKLDGSLGILYWVDDMPYIATRGSFESDQAKKGTEMLYAKYKHTFDLLKKDRTYLFEIIYPSNRIVLDYAGMEDLIMLAVIDNKTGNDLPLENLGFPLVKRYDGIADISTLKALESDNEEGFVIRFIPSNMRLKIKFAEYCRLHKILTQTSNIAIWEFLKDGKPMDEILEKIPDEFYDFVKKTKASLELEYAYIEKSAQLYYDSIMEELYVKYRNDGLPKGVEILHETIVNRKLFWEKFQKKDFALKVMGNPEYKKVSGILFNMLPVQDKETGRYALEGRPYAEIIWKMIRPEYSKPFKNAGQIEA